MGEEVAGDEKQQLGVGKSLEKAAHGTLVFSALCCASLGFYSPNSKVALELGQKFAVMREFGHYAGADGSNSDGGAAFDDEQPLPASDAIPAFELEDSCGKETTKCITDLGGKSVIYDEYLRTTEERSYLLSYVKTCEAFTKLFLSVPGREVVDCSREENGFDHSKDCSDSE